MPITVAGGAYFVDVVYCSKAGAGLRAMSEILLRRKHCAHWRHLLTSGAILIAGAGRRSNGCYGVLEWSFGNALLISAFTQLLSFR